MCKELQGTSDKTNKGALLISNAKHSDLWKPMLKYLLDPANVSGISTAKLYKEVYPSGAHIPESLQELFNYLEEHNTGRDRDIEVVQGFISQQNEEFHEFLCALLSKSLRLGVDVSTVNTIYGADFIPIISVMLAQNLFDKVGNIDRLATKHIAGQSFGVTLKLDGFRCLAIKHNGKVTLMSRNSKTIEGLVDIVAELESMELDNFVLDGELLLDDFEYMVTPSSEAYKAVSKVVRSKGEKTGVQLWAFDYVLHDIFVGQLTSRPYLYRRQLLDHLFDSTKYKTIRVLPQIASNVVEMEVVGDWLQKVRNAKQEGLMLNLNHAPYRFNRTRDLLKVKLMNDVDLTVIGVEEGAGRLENTLGALLCEYKGNVVRVGSGFSDFDRRQLWANQANMIGETICVQYFEETEDIQGNKSLRFPVFLRIV